MGFLNKLFDDILGFDPAPEPVLPPPPPPLKVTPTFDIKSLQDITFGGDEDGRKSLSSYKEPKKNTGGFSDVGFGVQDE
jgi:hypothetical protein